jgi:hypothetical protein
MEFWLDGFKRDSHPSPEVGWWEHLAAAFQEFLSMHDHCLSTEQRRAAFDYLLDRGLPFAERNDSTRKSHLTQEMSDQLSTMYASKLPPCEIVERERPTPGTPMPSLLTRELPADVFDIEHLPSDMPEHLIRELLGTGPHPSTDV